MLFHNILPAMRISRDESAALRKPRRDRRHRAGRRARRGPFACARLPGMGERHHAGHRQVADRAVEINGPVQIGEVRVAASDLVVADATGVCLIPRDVVLECSTPPSRRRRPKRCAARRSTTAYRCPTLPARPTGRSRRIEASLKLYVRPNDARRTRRLGH